MTDPQQITEEVPFHILDGAAKKAMEGAMEDRFPGIWEEASPDEKARWRQGIKDALPMLRRYFTAQVEEAANVDRLTAVVVDASEELAEEAAKAGMPGETARLNQGSTHFPQQVEEEPRYTLEQVREGLNNFLLSRNLLTVELSDALYDFSQRPVGVGADTCGDRHGGSELHAEVSISTSAPPVSADSDGNHQPGCSTCDDTRWLCDECKLPATRCVHGGNLSTSGCPGCTDHPDHPVNEYGRQQPSDGQEGGVEEGHCPTCASTDPAKPEGICARDGGSSDPWHVETLEARDRECEECEQGVIWEGSEWAACSNCNPLTQPSSDDKSGEG